MSVCSSVLPSRATAILVRSWLRVARSSSSISPLRRVQLGGQLVLDERLVELAGRGEAAAALEVLLRGAQLRALERRAARSASSGLSADGLGVFDDGEVVVLTLLGVAAAAAGRADAAQPPARTGQQPASERGAAARQRRGESVDNINTARGS